MGVAWASPREATAARHLADVLGMPCGGPGIVSGAEIFLVLENGVLSLVDHRQRGLKPLFISFDTPETASKKQPLGRAIGRRTRTVVDATAGWGEDARRLCAMGYDVTVVERSPVMAALLRNAADRAPRSPRAGFPLEVVERDAIDYLAENPEAWDCVYLDPMFPPKRRASTLPRRPLRLLRELVGDDPDTERLYDSAMRAAVKRVVVKRPDHGAPTFGPPSETVKGKLVCYDVYLKT